MSNFKEFVFKRTYGHAESVRKIVFSGTDGLMDINDFFRYFRREGMGFLDKGLEPNRQTLLHDFIIECIYVEIEYTLRKVFDEALPDIYEILELYGAPYYRLEKYRGKDYSNYLMKKLYKHVFKKFSEEVFTLLYQDRELLRAFNEIAAKHVSPLKVCDEEHAKYLSKDGVLRRCTYWPKWLKDGLFFRDRGRCAICRCDLTGLYATGSALAVDHIVPLANGGVNDPTNLQILCRTCNSQKGARSSNTKFWVATYW
ncbi:HNH endonuclease signature motif containing protein [Vibrio alginolyticus]|uniref:HNH endonuclease n=1 Tax=Vibrio alginolyticus TaxID=663 RepID=UPI0022AF3065|nr:HNH endonuclease signature motif containing protein [Vibrio alginolyticus]MCZ4387971.1 HNH endonuclease signature motif containing protein [Vibrio alginolyticus]